MTYMGGKILFLVQKKKRSNIKKWRPKSLFFKIFRNNGVNISFIHQLYKIIRQIME